MYNIKGQWKPKGYSKISWDIWKTAIRNKRTTIGWKKMKRWKTSAKLKIQNFNLVINNKRVHLKINREETFGFWNNSIAQSLLKTAYEIMYRWVSKIKRSCTDSLDRFPFLTPADKPLNLWTTHRSSHVALPCMASPWPAGDCPVSEGEVGLWSQ